MLGLRLNSPGPFWLEDLVFAALDHVRAVPQQAKAAAVYVGALANRANEAAAATRKRVRDLRAVRPEQSDRVAPPAAAELLDEPLEWTLATLPIAESQTGASTAISLHMSAIDQIDSAAYTLARMREDLAGVMKYAPIPGREPIALRAAPEFETSLEALLALSKANAATRPKERARTAA